MHATSREACKKFNQACNYIATWTREVPYAARVATTTLLGVARYPISSACSHYIATWSSVVHHVARVWCLIWRVLCLARYLLSGCVLSLFYFFPCYNYINPFYSRLLFIS